MEIIYLDSNQFFRIFERETDELFTRFRDMLEQNGCKLAVSEVNMIEACQGLKAGASTDVFKKGLELLESLEPVWVYLGGVANEELRLAFTSFQKGETHIDQAPFVDWPAFLLAMSDNGKFTELFPPRIIKMSISEAILFLHNSELIVGNEQFWSSELNNSNLAFRNMIRGKNRDKIFHEIFIGSVVLECSTFSRSNDELRKFAEQLWNKPDICPGFRLNFEVSVATLGDNRTDWTINRFYDHTHMTIIPYVRSYIGIDRGQRHAISEFDRRFGKAFGAHYAPRCYRRVEDIF
jgi:hypothetical protein